MKSSNRRVAISAGVLACGGPETHLRILIRLLSNHGIQTVLYGSDCWWSQETLSLLKDCKVDWRIPSPTFRKSRFAAKCVAGLMGFTNRPQDALSLYCVGAGNSHLFLGKRLNSRIPRIYHELVFPATGSLSSECIRAMDASIANSRWVFQEMEKEGGGKPIRIIPFLTADRRIAPPAAREPRKPDRVLKIGYLGRLEERKRPHRLVKEWQRLMALPGVGRAELHLYGTDEGRGLHSQLTAWVEEQRLGNQIFLHGAYEHSQLPEILGNLDLVVLPSEWEGLPLVLVEAMQHGVPFVATAAGGTAEFGVNNPDVRITPIEWDSFVEGFVEFVSGLRAGAVDGVRLHHWAESRYGYETVAPQWLEALTNARKYFGLEAVEDPN